MLKHLNRDVELLVEEKKDKKDSSKKEKVLTLSAIPAQPQGSKYNLNSKNRDFFAEQAYQIWHLAVV